MKEIQDLQAGGIGINIDFELDDADFLYVVSNMQHKNSSRTKETICYYRYYRFSAKMSESDQIRPTESGLPIVWTINRTNSSNCSPDY